MDSELQRCRIEGRQARADGLPCVSPYHFLSPKSDYWCAGWHEGWQAADHITVERVQEANSVRELMGKVTVQAEDRFARDNGYVAGEHNAPVSHNPYVRGSIAWFEWINGWMEAQKDYARADMNSYPLFWISKPVTWIVLILAGFTAIVGALTIIGWIGSWI